MPVPIRSVQLDLARQMETLDYIRQFIDLAADAGYNALTLYLEARVKTPSFPYPDEQESYSLAEMEQVVAYAHDKNMIVIPVVSFLGHAELFLKYKPMQHLAEIQDGKRGRFGTGKSVMCPSSDETYRFAETYWQEILSVFTDDYVHIGCDEVWDLGFCDQCKERLEQGLSHSELFAEHVIRMHSFLHDKLGKTVMLWEDMSADYPDLVEALPRDIIRIVWKYEPVVDCTPSYFGRIRKDNRFRDYDRLDIPYWYAPRETDLRNITSFTEFAESLHSPAGVLLTIWERKFSLLLVDHPKIAFAGKLWSTPVAERDPQSIWQQTCDELFGSDDPQLASTLWAIGNRADWRESLANPASFLKGSPTAYMIERDAQNRQLYQSLQSCADSASRNRDIIEQTIINLELERLSLDLLSWSQALQRFWAGAGALSADALSEKLDTILARICPLTERYQALVDRWRPAPILTPCSDRYQEAVDAWRTWKEQVLGSGRTPDRVIVRYCLDDYYGAQTVKLEVKNRSTGELIELFSGVTKPSTVDLSEQPFYYRVYLLDEGDWEPAITVSSHGYEGIAFAYTQMILNGKTYVPESISNIEGQVVNSDALLTNDTTVCKIDSPPVGQLMEHPDLAEKISTFRITFKESTVSVETG